MLFDAENLFSKDQAVTNTAVSTNTLDLGPGDHGPSENISLVVTAGGFFAGAGAVELQTADACAADGTLTSPVIVATYPVSADALLKGGTVVSSRLPHGLKRYVRLNYNMTTAGADGTVTAGLVLDAQQAETIARP